MKSLKSLLCVFLICFCFTTTGLSSTISKYITFEGTISSITDDAGIISDANLSVGDAISYLVRFDYESQYWRAAGTRTYNNGTVYTYNDSMYSGKHSTFVDYIKGSLLQPKDGGFFNAPGDVAEYNHTIARQHSDWGRYRNFYLGSDNSFLRINQSFAGVQLEYLIDFRGRYSFLSGFNTAYDAEGNASTLFFKDLAVANISYEAPEGYDPETGEYTPSAPVPEPASLMLFGIGLLGLAKWMRNNA